MWVGDVLAMTVSGATVYAPNGTAIAFQASLIEGAGPGAWAVSGVPACGAPVTGANVRLTADYVAPE